jgi:hypothetical protein
MKMPEAGIEPTTFALRMLYNQQFTTSSIKQPAGIQRDIKICSLLLAVKICIFFSLATPF